MNRLQFSDSPYLLQHANNPVDWYEWSKEAFERAKKEDKPIFLSIGYSTCHWCHVMARESFENEEIAKILNENFISIKLDREERPDIDKKFQKIYQIMHSRGGGWPLTIIMTPNGDTFYSATYLPPHFSHFGPGLKEILLQIAKDWKENRKKILEIAENIKKYEKSSFKKVEVKEDVIKQIINQAIESFDMEYGGVKGAPKFPMESTLDLLIDIYLLTKNEEIKKRVNLTLEKMAKGGIFDQVEGGFYRYSTDNRWEIPHFEKMLYNNANLPFVYLRWYEIEGNELFREVVFRSLDEMIKRYKDNGLFVSASNAESEGREGAYFVYEYDEVKEAFSEFENQNELLEFFGIEKYGSFNGRNNLTINGKKPKNYKEALERLKKIREKREFPFIDTKKITAWNAMMISALLKAGCFNKKYEKEAFSVLSKLLEVMYEDRLFHSFNKSKKLPALLEDYAYLIKALIDAYEVSFDKKYIDFANRLFDEVKEFKKDVWYMNKQRDIEADFSDSAYSSSLSILAQSLFRLGVIEYDLEKYNLAKEIVEFGGSYIKKYPLFYPSITKAYLMRDRIFVLNAHKSVFCENLEYPYLESKEGESFEICNINSCLLKTKNLKEIKEFLLKL